MFKDNDFKYEYKNIRGIIKPTFWTTLVLQLIILIFFFSVGHFNPSSDDEIFLHFNSLISFSTLLTALIVSVFGNVKSCKYIIDNYMGDNKIRLYVFPNGRGKLLKNKIFTFNYLLFLTEIITLFIFNIVSLIVFRLLNLLPSDINFLNLISLMLSVLFLNFFIVTLSIVLGVRFTSKVVTVVSSVILVAILANISIELAVASPFILLILSVVLVIISAFSISYCCKYIDNDELIR